MSITDELRGYVKHLDSLFDDLCMVCEKLTAIADRIDAEHKRAIGYVNDYDPETMAEHGWVRLPKDADGEYIHIGDEMDGVDKYDTLREVSGEVVTIHFDGMGSGTYSHSVGLRVWSEDHKSYHVSYIDPDASVYRHHHKPTLEDVLEKALNEAAMLDRSDGYWPSAADVTNLVNECAAKVREVMGE